MVHTGVPGAQIVVTEQGRDQVTTSGVGDLTTGDPFPDNSHVRIASNTKSFVATVLLELVTEGKLELDAPVDRYLPGVLVGNGNDGTRITVRNLLQHTSGLPDVYQVLHLLENLEQVRLQRSETADLVRRTLATPAHFAPGEKFEYSNTNYLVIGMIIERVTGQSIDEAITRRIIEPLGLHDTYYPLAGEIGLRNPHPLGYFEHDGVRIEFTELDPSGAGASGAMVSTGADLNRFFIALLGGKLLPPAQLDEMRRNPVTSDGELPYGLGIEQIPVSCGKAVWGHRGSTPGFVTVGGATTDGRAVTVMINQLSTTTDIEAVAVTALDTAICAIS
ncbi:beta-lactamase family protein [Nocardia sp. NBC_01503]|uniref:serine hydrolase domain-containing protein n=1 Tax=Nocardia sp. NBC_01503 TaxID=2975997 RepID=UPI002E7B2C9A|nr:serine hydrolase domain-containing protein [Nocardia sp. NBC_01503]WTL31996.1 beta-lactamase family protein [Nocardia sp. NBC_01503]